MNGKLISNQLAHLYVNKAKYCMAFGCLPSELRKEKYVEIQEIGEIILQLKKKMFSLGDK